MTALVALLPAYRKLAQLQMQVAYGYRGEVVGGVVAVLLRIFLLKVIWTAVYAGRPTLEGQSLPGVITFLTLANLQIFLMRPMIVWYLQRRIHEGLIGLDLVRPVPFLGQILSQQIGATLGNVPFVLAALPLAVVVGGLAPPASPTAGLAYVASLVLAYAIATLIGLLMGLAAFWTVQTVGVDVIYNFAAQFFGGALVPLAFFPSLLRTIADWLPFQATVFIPASIYTGSIASLPDIGRAIAVQVFWVIALAILAVLVWRRARRIVTVYGG